MKNQLIIIALLVIASPLTAQITITTPPCTEQHPCFLAIDNDTPPELEEWLNNNGRCGEASSACGNFIEPWPNDYDPANWDYSNPCGPTVTVNSEVTDDCGSTTVIVSALYRAQDITAPQFAPGADSFIPDDMTIHIEDCFEGYTFPNGYFEDPGTGES